MVSVIHEIVTWEKSFPRNARSGDYSASFGWDRDLPLAADGILLDGLADEVVISASMRSCPCDPLDALVGGGFGRHGGS